MSINSYNLQNDDSLENAFDGNNNRFDFGNSFRSKTSDNEIGSMFDSNVISVGIDDINKLNIIINDDDCSNVFIESVYRSLDSMGILYRFTKGIGDEDIYDATVITFDQQYISGPRIALIGAYQNGRRDNSDALALTMQASFEAHGVATDGIFCGKRGYRKSDNGVATRVPTPTEEAIVNGTNTSFVTIALGTNIPDAHDMTNIMVEGLARYADYVARQNNCDLVYRVEDGNDLDSLTKVFNRSEFDISNFNKLNTGIPNDAAIINPDSQNFLDFDSNFRVEISEAKQDKSLS